MNPMHSFEIREGQSHNARYYSGVVQKCVFTNQLEFYGFKVTCLHDFKINFHGEKDSTIYMCINLADTTTLQLAFDATSIAIPPFASVMIPFKNAETISFHGNSNKNYNFLVLRIERSHLDAEQVLLLETLQEDNVFLNAGASNRILMPNLELCEMARKLKHIEKDTCEDKFIARGYCNILIGLKLKEFLKEEHKNASSGILRTYEIQELEALTEEIINNPEHEYSIKDLCRKTGLSVSKLQAGFKAMHNSTVAIFIRNVRLEKALDLLKHTDLNVSEIVYSVGLNSRSYFCRIFKKRFKCSPKSYQQQLKIDPMAS